MEIKKTLEQLCPFAAKCAESDYGDEKRCRDNYFDCKIFQNYLKEEIERYETFRSNKK